MKNYFLLTLLFSALLFYSCKKDKCEENGQGQILVENATTYQIDAFIDTSSNVITIDSGMEHLFTVDYGYHNVNIVDTVFGARFFGFNFSDCEQKKIKLE